MTEIAGYYVLHSDQRLEFAPDGTDVVINLDNDDTVIRYWPVQRFDRLTIWNMLIEALSLGADHRRVKHLMDRWGCTDADAQEYIKRIGGVYLHHEPFVDWIARCDKEGVTGHGDTALGAMACLCRNLGFDPKSVSFAMLANAAKEIN